MVDPNLKKFVTRAGGMLPLEVYDRLYELAATSNATTMVEIGTAHGAGTIALCLGALSANKTPDIYTVDRFEGRYSSRSAYGSVCDNVEIVRANFRSAGIDPYVKVFAGSSSDFAEKECPQVIDILVLDADGRIDRDLINLGHKLVDGAPIVIDDYGDRAHLMVRSNGNTFVDLKHVITKLLLDRYIADGLIEIMGIMSSTAFCRKKAGSIWDPKQMADSALDCYRELVFTDVDYKAFVSWIAKKAKTKVPPLPVRPIIARRA